MKVDLIELLAAREMVHPSSVTAILVREEDVLFRLTGYPWWRVGGHDDENYEFSFLDVTDGRIDPLRVVAHPDDCGTDALDDFSIVPLDPLDWEQAGNCRIFCNGPLPQAAAFYSDLERYLREADSFRPVSAFLNEGEKLAEFLALTASNSFLLAECPDTLCEWMVAELNRQKVPHNILRAEPGAVDARLRVRIDGSDFLCRSAIAILPD